MRQSDGVISKAFITHVVCTLSAVCCLPYVHHLQGPTRSDVIIHRNWKGYIGYQGYMGMQNALGAADSELEETPMRHSVQEGVQGHKSITVLFTKPAASLS